MNDNSTIQTQDLRKIIGRNIRSLRAYAGKSQQDIGAFIGVSFQQIQKYESGVNRISADDLYRLAVFLEVNINDFFASLGNSEATVPDKEFLKIIRQLQKIKNPKIRNKIMDLAIALEVAIKAVEANLERKTEHTT